MSRPRKRPDRYTDARGYVQVRTAGGFVPEHRLVMAAVLGRDLARGERVAHLNGDRTDNRPDNLRLVLEPGPATVPATSLVCPRCGVPYLSPVAVEGKPPPRPVSAVSGAFRKLWRPVRGRRGPGPGQLTLWAVS